MSKLKREQLMVILAFGLHISRVDNHFDSWEKRVLQRFADTIRLTVEEKSRLLRAQFSLKAGIEKLKDHRSRMLLLMTLCVVACSDGDPSESELNFIERVVRLIGGKVTIRPRHEWPSYEEELFSELHAVVGS